MDFLSWRWIFFVNIPLGAFAAWALDRRFPEKVCAVSTDRCEGGVLLAVGASLIILGLLEGGMLWARASVPSLATLVGGTWL